MPESYAETKARIEQALHRFCDCEKSNIAAMAREFQVPVTRLRARWNRRPSKQDRPGPNKKLTDDQELAVCLYLWRLHTIGTSARFPMVTSCANSILRRCRLGWTSRFLQRHPESENKRHLNDSASSRIIPTISSPGLIDTKLFVTKNLFKRATDTTSTIKSDRAFKSAFSTVGGLFTTTLYAVLQALVCLREGVVFYLRQPLSRGNQVEDSVLIPLRGLYWCT